MLITDYISFAFTDFEILASNVTLNQVHFHKNLWDAYTCLESL